MDSIESGEDYLIIGNNSNYENVKGVFKINSISPSEQSSTFSHVNSIKPLGIKFNFTGNVVEGLGEYALGLRHFTKGFFIVRQKRIPTILAQGVGIATSSKSYLPLFSANASIAVPNTTSVFFGDVLDFSGLNPAIINRYFMQSFLQNPLGDNDQTILGPSLVDVGDRVNNNALLCPEASLRPNIFENIFNSSEFTISPAKYQSSLYSLYPNGTPFLNSNNTSSIHFSNISLIKNLAYSKTISKIAFIRPGVDLTSLDNYKFSSKAGDSTIGHLFKDPVYGDYQDSTDTAHVANGSIKTNNAVRGEFNSYLGLSVNNIKNSNYYNIMENNYDFNSY